MMPDAVFEESSDLVTHGIIDPFMRNGLVRVPQQ
jgi:hypothetical protein